MPSGLGSFSIDSLLGNNSSRKSSSSTSSSHNLSRGGPTAGQSCCTCEQSRKPRDNCRCKCHDAHRPAVSNAQKERKRTTFTEHQKKGMLRYFEQHKYIDANQREQVAAELGIEPNQVKRKWQNLRSKNKESQKTQEPNFYKSHSFLNTSGMTNMHSVPNMPNILHLQLPDQLNRRHMSYSAAAMPYPKLINHTPAAHHLGHGHYRNNLALNPVLKKDFNLQF